LPALAEVVEKVEVTATVVDLSVMAAVMAGTAGLRFQMNGQEVAELVVIPVLAELEETEADPELPARAEQAAVVPEDFREEEELGYTVKALTEQVVAVVVQTVFLHPQLLADYTVVAVQSVAQAAMVLLELSGGLAGRSHQMQHKIKIKEITNDNIP
jgi:hypothetical protein